MNSLKARLSLVLLWMLFNSSTLAHSIPIYLEIKLGGPKLELGMTDPDGLPILTAEIAYLLNDGKGHVTQRAFDEEGLGLYTAPKPNVQPGKYTFTVRDTTFSPESLEVSKRLVWPPVKQFDLVLPASTLGIPSALGIFLFMGAPILLVGGLVAWAIRSQKKRESEEVSPES